MDTPSAPAPIQGRRGKKHRMDLSSPGEMDLDRAIDLIIGDSSLPPHLKTAMGFLLEMKDQIASVKRNKELVEENNCMRLRNNELQEEVDSLKSQITLLKQALASSKNSTNVRVDSQVNSSPHNYEELERRRSIVIVGVKECNSPVSSDRLFSRHLSLHRSQLRRAPPLRYFKEKGIYVRPSLSKLERDHLRAERLARINSVSPARAHDVQLQSSSVNGTAVASSQTPFTISDSSEVIVSSNADLYRVRLDRGFKRGGGVALLVRTSLMPHVVFSESLLPRRFYEILCCQLRSGPIRVIIVYRTPNCTAALSEQLLKA
ncbi:hypothetical protein COOONC_11904 [Cooperia oncophora]